MNVRRAWQSAVFELFDAVRSRRALLLAVLYLAVSVLSMSATISALGNVEDQLCETLKIERAEGRTGTVSATLWRSQTFQRLASHVVGDSIVYDDIKGRHPAELVYAWLVFAFVPLLTVLIAGNRIANDIRSGAVRFMLARVTRLEWSLGKFVGNAMLLALGLVLGGFAAWCVAAWKLGGADVAALLPSILGWSLRAWFLSLAWLGFALGVSHFFRSGTKADAASIVLMMAFAAAPKLYAAFGDSSAFLAQLFPSAVESALWRASFVPVAVGAVWLLALGLLYLSIGYAYFSRIDAR